MTEKSPYKSTTRESIALPLVFALGIPFLIGLAKPGWLRGVFEFIDVFAILLPMLSLAWVFGNWAKGEPLFKNLFANFLPNVVSLQGVEGSRLRRVPWVTSALIVANTYAFFALPERIVDQWVFPPYGDPTAAHIVASIFTAAFLHADFSHLFGNMVFLWTFGSALEDRIGAAPFALVYLAATVLCKLATMGLLMLQADHTSSLVRLANYHSLGASGAISGVMGAFVVRCYFTRVKMTMPIFVLPFVANTVRVQSLVLVGLCFAMDLKGSAASFAGGKAGIGYWAHAGGYLAGFALAYLMRLHRQAAEEAVEHRAESFAASQENDARATELYRAVLERHPQDEKALRHFLRLHQHDPEREGAFFSRLIQVSAKTSLKSALGLMEEYFPRYCRSVPGDLLLRFGLHYFENSDLFKARICFEAASDQEGPWRPKAMLKLAEVMACQGNEAGAREVCAEIGGRFPQTPFARQAALLERGIASGSTVSTTV